MIDLTLLIAELRRRWRLMVAFVLAGSGVLAAVAVFKTPEYSASVVMVSTSSDRSSLSGMLSSSLGGLAALTGLTSASDDPASQEALAVLRSRGFLERFVSEMRLNKDLFPDTWNDAGASPTPAKVAKRFSDDVLNVSEDKKTGLVTVEVRWKNRMEAAEWANNLVRRLNSEMSDRAISQANMAIGYLEREAKSESIAETRDALNRLMEAQLKQRMLATVNREYSFRVVDWAMPPDPDDMESPNRILLLLAGPFVGALLGMLVIVGRCSFELRKSGSREEFASDKYLS